MESIINQDVLNIVMELSKPLPQEAIQRTKKENTRKAYDTSGYNYQTCVNRFNEVLGNQWGYDYKILRENTGTFKTGTPYFEFTIQTSIWILSPDNSRSCFGGHISSIHADGLKGAITNAFKKTAAMWGVGREAYEGTLDDDTAYPEDTKTETKKSEPKKDEPKKTEPKKSEPAQPPVTKKEPVQQSLPVTGGEPTPTTPIFKESYGRDPIPFDGVKEKMATSKNVYELNNRCKKYRPDYDLLDKEHQTFIKVERDKRKVWLTLGEGNYTDMETKGINKDDSKKEGG